MIHLYMNQTARQEWEQNHQLQGHPPPSYKDVTEY